MFAVYLQVEPWLQDLGQMFSALVTYSADSYPHGLTPSFHCSAQFLRDTASTRGHRTPKHPFTVAIGRLYSRLLSAQEWCGLDEQGVGRQRRESCRYLVLG